ncbi:hypothetical protein SALBM311S_01573 [Streptomyces alboniger]
MTFCDQGLSSGGPTLGSPAPRLPGSEERLAGRPADDAVVNVLTCGDAVGIGSYVYREQDGSYQNVFKAEEPPVYAEIDRGDLVVTKQVYEKGDPVSAPSGETVITYHWSGSRFAQTYSSRNDYGKTAEDGPTPAPAD